MDILRNFSELITETMGTPDLIQRQYILAEMLAEIKLLESTNRDELARQYLGDATIEGDHFTVVIKTPEIVTVDQARVKILLEQGWNDKLINKVFPIKRGLSKKYLAKHPTVEYAVTRKSGKSTVKITLNTD